MKTSWNAKVLPAALAVLGAAGFGLRQALYAVGVDEKGLLVTGHPLEAAVWVVTALALAVIGAAVWKLDGSDVYGDNFSPSVLAAVGHVLAGAGLLLAVMSHTPVMPGLLGKMWKVLGLLSGPCLAAAGVLRGKGKQPFFLLHLIPCLFLVAHVLNMFQTWSGNPQLMDYVFDLGGGMTLVLFSFYTASFDADTGKRRLQLGTGLAAVFLCLVSLPQSQYPTLYLAGFLWAVTDLCTLQPKPRRAATESENQNEAP